MTTYLVIPAFAGEKDKEIPKHKNPFSETYVI